MPQFGFQRLEVYQLAKALVLKSYQLTKKFPPDEKYALVQQINRAAISIPSNIVEGYGRTTAKDKSHFLNMAYSSMMELVCQYEISNALGYITDDELDDMMDSAYRLSIKINSFRQVVGGEPPSGGAKS